MAQSCQEFDSSDIQQKYLSNPQKLPSLEVFDSPICSYYTGAKNSYTSLPKSSNMRQSINTTQETLDTPTKTSSSSPKSQLQSSNKLSQNEDQNMINFSEYVNSYKKKENSKKAYTNQLHKKQQLKSQYSNPSFIEIKEQKDETNENSDEEEHNIWDNSQPESLGIDCENFMNQEGQPLTFYQLYRIRQRFFEDKQKYISRSVSIEDFFVIAKYYKKPIKQAELQKQQEYLDERYFNQSVIKQAQKQKILSSAQQLEYKEESLSSARNPFKQRSLIPSSDNLKKRSITNQLFNKNKINNLFQNKQNENQSLNQISQYYKKLNNTHVDLSQSQTFNSSRSLPQTLQASQSKIIQQENEKSINKISLIHQQSQPITISSFSQTSSKFLKKIAQISQFDKSQNQKNILNQNSTNQKPQQSVSSHSLSTITPNYAKVQLKKQIQLKVSAKLEKDKCSMTENDMFKTQRISKETEHPLNFYQKQFRIIKQCTQLLNNPCKSKQQLASYCDL